MQLNYISNGVYLRFNSFIFTSRRPNERQFVVWMCAKNLKMMNIYMYKRRNYVYIWAFKSISKWTIFCLSVTETLSIHNYPFPTCWHILTLLQQTNFENNVTKGETAHNEQLLLLTNCFQLYLISIDSYIEIFHIFAYVIFKFVCCRFVVCGKGFYWHELRNESNDSPVTKVFWRILQQTTFENMDENKRNCSKRASFPLPQNIFNTLSKVYLPFPKWYNLLLKVSQCRQLFDDGTR